MNHDCSKEIDAVLTPFKSEIGRMENDAKIRRDQIACLQREVEEQVLLNRMGWEREASLRGKLDQTEKTIADRDATIAELRNHLSQANAALSELAACYTAADFQRIREKST